MRKPKLRITQIILLILSVSIMACSEPSQVEEQTPPAPPEPAPSPAPPKVVLDGDDVVLARVAGEPITRYELEQTIRATLGETSAGRLDEAGRQKVLQSLVASRAIARVQEAEMTPQEIAEIDKKTRAYREQLLVKRYLAQHAAPQPVTGEMVREYYQAHPERFGSRYLRKYEMISGQPNLKSAERDNLITVLGRATETADWQNWVAELKEKGYPMSYREGMMTDNVLHPRLENLMKDLKTGETSNLVFIKGVPYVVRIVEEKQIPPQPLDKVSEQIRRALVPVQLKKAVKQASEQVLAKSEVVYEEE